MQRHSSRERCRDFSCLAQSYLCLKVSQQKVHLKMRSSFDANLSFFRDFDRGTDARPFLLREDMAERLEARDWMEESLTPLSMLVVEEAPRWW